MSNDRFRHRRHTHARLTDCADCGYPITIEDGKYVCDCPLFFFLKRKPMKPDDSSFQGEGARLATDSQPTIVDRQILGDGDLIEEMIEEMEE